MIFSERRSGVAVARGIGASAVLLAVAFACGGQSTDNPTHASGGSHGGGVSSGASGGSAQAGVAGNATSVAGKPTSTTAGSTAVDPGSAGQPVGGAGNPAVESCDAECLHSVVNQKSDFGTTWESSWFLIGCKDVFDHRCQNVGTCSYQGAAFEDKGAWTLETFPVGGVVGQRYKVTFKFNAIAAAKEYERGTRDQADQVPPDPTATPLDSFYRDGVPIPSNSEVWRLSVFDETGKEARHYYMNAFPPLVSPGMSYETRLRNYLLSYTKSIIVVGGGKITHRLQDSNCVSAENCGAMTYNPQCEGPRNLPNEPADLALPAMYQDPEDHQLKPTLELSAVDKVLIQPWHGQLGHLSVVSVEATDEPVTHDFL